MKDKSNSFWAAIFIVGATTLVSLALFAPIRDKDVTMGVLAFASSIITGAFGYIQGHRDGQNNPLDEEKK